MDASQTSFVPQLHPAVHRLITERALVVDRIFQWCCSTYFMSVLFQLNDQTNTTLNVTHAYHLEIWQYEKTTSTPILSMPWNMPSILDDRMANCKTNLVGEKNESKMYLLFYSLLPEVFFVFGPVKRLGLWAPTTSSTAFTIFIDHLCCLQTLSREPELDHISVFLVFLIQNGSALSVP